MNKKNEKKKSSFISELIQYIVLIIGVLVASFVVQTFIITSFTVSGSSMYPTLKDGDRILMYRLKGADRFDVVVIDSPDEAYELDKSGNIAKDIFGNKQRKMYIKRVIGMPGDTLEYKDDTLWINNEQYDEPYLTQSRQSARNQGVYYMPNATLEQIIARARTIDASLPQGNTTLKQVDGKWVIPDDYYFVLGDNRQNSKDSEEYGLVHKSLVKGVAVLRFWPLDKIQTGQFK